MKTGPVIGVIGGGHCDDDIAALAEEVGRLIARQNAMLICGGLRGVMEAACRGAMRAGGTTIGVLPGIDKREANQYVEIPLVTGMMDARNIIIVRSSDAVIAIDGSHGTLSEMAFCLKFGVPLVAMQSWDVDPKVVRADSPAEAVRMALALCRA